MLLFRKSTFKLQLLENITLVRHKKKRLPPFLLPVNGMKVLFIVLSKNHSLNYEQMNYRKYSLLGVVEHEILVRRYTVKVYVDVCRLARL